MKNGIFATREIYNITIINATRSCYQIGIFAKREIYNIVDINSTIAILSFFSSFNSKSLGRSQNHRRADEKWHLCHA
jgi:hypothetical protein